jgi:hypothetical protein
VNDRERELQMDLFALRYLEALEHGDLDTVAVLWAEAADDAELERLLHEVNDELAGDALQVAKTENIVLKALEQHLPSALVICPASGPLTVADVAEQLFRAPPPGLTTEDLKLNDALRAQRQLVPEQLGLGQVLAWAAQFGDVHEPYWKAFRQAALKLRLQRDAEANYQMAARPGPPKPPEVTP